MVTGYFNNIQNNTMKIYSFFIICFTGFLLGTISQSAQAQGKSPFETAEYTVSKNVFDNAFYLKIGISQPVGVFGQTAYMSDYSELAVQKLANGLGNGIGAKTGYSFDMGTIFYFKEMNLSLIHI